jgi:hypothetical protein
MRNALLILSVLMTGNILGQTSVYPGGFGLRSTMGFSVPPAASQKHLIGAHAYGFEFNYRYNFSGVKEWEKHYRYPYSGFAVQFLSLGGKLIGNSYNIMPYIGLPINKNRIFDSHFRLSSGLSYMSQKFDLARNRNNTLIGSHANIVADIMLQIHWKIDRKVHLLTGLSLTHFSNGAFTQPQTSFVVLGINAGLTINTGRPVAVNNYSFPILDKGIKLVIWSGMWRKEAGTFTSSKYTAAVLGINALKRYSIKGAYGAGIDAFLDQSLEARKTDAGTFRIGALLAYEILLGRMSIPIQQGFYLVNPLKSDGLLYQRIGWRYHLNSAFAAQLSLKFHNLKNDHAELGLVYTLKP